MGCPDWPKCFGLFVPPTEVDEIPQSFFESHPQFESKTFNAFQTWVEYVNRLVGATIGLLMFLTALLSLTFFRKDRRIFFLSLAAMLLTGFEGWLGKLVVDKNLAGGMVTVHLLVAMVIVALLIWANYLVAVRNKTAGEAPKAGSGQLVWLGVAVIVLTVLQILVGTQVRESVDHVAQQLGESRRAEWLQGSVFYSIHKVGWLLMAGLVAVWLRNVMAQMQGNKMVQRLSLALILCIAAEICFGIVLANFDLPPTMQPLHMLFANLIFAAEFSIWIHVAGRK